MIRRSRRLWRSAVAQCVLKVNRRLGTWCTLSIFTLPLTSGPAHWSTTLLPSRSHGFIAPALADRTDRLRVPVGVQVSQPGRPHGRDLTRASSSPPVAIAAPTAARARHRSPPGARTQVSAGSQEGKNHTDAGRISMKMSWRANKEFIARNFVKWNYGFSKDEESKFSQGKAWR